MVLNMDFHTFLDNVNVIDEQSCDKKLTIYPWMAEIRNHDHVIASVPRMIGTTTYTMLSALYDILFTPIQNVRIVTYQGGYRKKHMINMLLTHYSWLMASLKMDKSNISVTDSTIKIGDNTIEVFGIHELNPNSSYSMLGRGRTIEKIYADIYCIETDDVFTIIGHQFQQAKKCTLFFQGIQSNSKVKKLFDEYYYMDDMDKVSKILKEEFYWYAIKINHNLTDDMVEEIKEQIGVERFEIEYGVR